MTTAQDVKMSVTVKNDSPIQDYIHPDNQTQPSFEMTPGFKPFTVLLEIIANFVAQREFLEPLEPSPGYTTVLNTKWLWFYIVTGLRKLSESGST